MWPVLTPEKMTLALQSMGKNRGMQAPETFLEFQEMFPDDEAWWTLT
jgi:hypothetical protein